MGVVRERADISSRKLVKIRRGTIISLGIQRSAATQYTNGGELSKSIRIIIDRRKSWAKGKMPAESLDISRISVGRWADSSFGSCDKRTRPIPAIIGHPQYSLITDAPALLRRMGDLLGNPSKRVIESA